MKIPWRRKWQPIPVFLPGKSHGWRSLSGYSPWGPKSWTRLSDFTSLHFFWCLCQKLSLSLLYFNKTLLHKSSDQSSLVSGPGLNSSPPEAKKPSIFHGSATTFHWERLRRGGEGDARGWSCWMAFPTWWTWVWVSSRSWQWTGKPGVLQSMGSQRVRHDWATELN